MHRKILQRRYIAMIAVIAASFLLMAGVLVYATIEVDRTVAATKSARDEMIKQMDAKIAAAKKAKEEARLKKEAEEKKAAEEAAALAAAKEKERVAQSASQAATAPLSCATSPAAITVVINKKHCFSPLSWTPSDLGSVNGYLMRAEAANQMLAMMSAAEAAGSGFGLTSAYRSYDNQAVTYNHWVAVNGSAAAADTVSARPGYSEHQTGLAADLDAGSCALSCFGGSAAYQWLKTNAASYGFIERYPAGQSTVTGYSPEPWHWRYVGTSVAQAMQQSGTPTIEAYFGISGGGY